MAEPGPLNMRLKRTDSRIERRPRAPRGLDSGSGSSSSSGVGSGVALDVLEKNGDGGDEWTC